MREVCSGHLSWRTIFPSDDDKVRQQWSLAYPPTCLSFVEYRICDWTPPSIAYSCFSPFSNEMSCHKRSQQLLYATIIDDLIVMKCALQDLLEAIAAIYWSCVFMAEQTPILVYIAESTKKARQQWFCHTNQYLSYQLNYLSPVLQLLLGIFLPSIIHVGKERLPSQFEFVS